MCVQVAKPFLADRPGSGLNDSIIETNVTRDVPVFVNTTNTAQNLFDSFESDIQSAYFILGAFCVVGVTVQILCWIYCGCKLNYWLKGPGGEGVKPPSQQNSQFYMHNKCSLIVASFLLCFVTLFGFAHDEVFRPFAISFTVNTLDWETNDASNLVTLYLVFSLVCVCTSIVLSKFVQVNILMIGSILIELTGTILMASMIMVTEYSLWIGACLLGLGLGNVLPNTLNAGKRLTRQPSMILSLIFAGAYAGRIVTPQVTGYVLDNEDPLWFLYLGVVCSSGMLVLSVVFQILLLCSRKFENVEQPETDFPLETL